MNESSGDLWVPIDEHPAVRRPDNPAGAVSRDQAYAAARAGRIRCLWLSKRRLLVHIDLLHDLAASGKPQ
jgi:hypothetical protein